MDVDVATAKQYLLAFSEMDKEAEGRVTLREFAAGLARPLASRRTSPT